MNRIYLLRHSAPDKHSALQNACIPLSHEGKKLAKQLVDKLSVPSPVKVVSSPYIRAKQTAEAISASVITDARLAERQISNPDTFTKEIWAKQYIDMDAHNDNGESFRMVQQRMNNVINAILAEMNDGESAFVVSHAAAICAYLQQYCHIQVTDVETKHRRISFHHQIILDGKINTPSCFILTFDKGLSSVSYME